MADNRQSTNTSPWESGSSLTKVTVEKWGKTWTFPLGRNYQYKRQEGAVTLECAVSTLPFEIEIDLNPDGSWTFRHGTTIPDSDSGGNSYWHLAQDVPKDEPTEDQTKAIARWIFHPEESPFGLGVPNAKLQHWALKGMSTTDVERIGNDGKRALYNHAR